MLEKTQSTHAVFLQVEIRGIPATPNISGLNVMGMQLTAVRRNLPRDGKLVLELVTLTLVACPSIVDTLLRHSIAAWTGDQSPCIWD